MFFVAGIFFIAGIFYDRNCRTCVKRVCGSQQVGESPSRSQVGESPPRSQFFAIRTDPKAANNLFIFSCDKLAYKWVYATLSLNWPGLLAV